MKRFPKNVKFYIWTKKVSRDMLISIQKWLRITLGFSKRVNFSYKANPKHGKKEKNDG